MDKLLRYTLGKEEKLKSRKKIEFLFSRGKSFSSFPLRVLYAETTDMPNPKNIQAGFSASSKNFKKSVDRNRIKRLLRESYRLQKNDLEESILQSGKKWILFFIYTGKEIPEYNLVFDKMKFALARIQKISNEKNSPAT